MTRNASFVRKIVYISVMAVLLLPLYYLSAPAGANVDKNSGGKLEQLRREYDLSQSSLGEVDPTSETMKLATLGMRGVATTILWQQANEHKKKENWDAFATVLRQISKLQPHFIQVWIFQSWNQSYNVSVEFDDYRYRYHWVKKGINYLIEGTRYNRRDVKLQAELGRVFGHKIGRSDERRQFRRMFRVDEDFHDDLPINPDDPNVEVRDYEQKYDNWLVAREFCLTAIRIAESPRGSKELGSSELLFYSEPIMKRMSYAESIIDEGYFGREALDAWIKSGNEWEAYGERIIPTSIPGLSIQLGMLEEIEADVEEKNAALERMADEMEADVRDEIRKEKYDALSDEERAAYDTPEEDRTIEQQGIAAQVERKLEVDYSEIFDRAPDDVKEEAVRLIAQQKDLLTQRRFTQSYRNIVNYEYWAMRCQAEQQPDMLEARKLVFQAAKLHDQGKLETVTDLANPENKTLGAKEVYEESWEKFANVFLEYPVMLDNPETEDLLDHIKDYGRLLTQLEGEKKELPKDFPLRIIVDMYDTVGQQRADSETLIAQWVESTKANRARQAREANPRTATPRPPIPPEGVELDSEDPRAAVPSPPVVE